MTGRAILAALMVAACVDASSEAPDDSAARTGGAVPASRPAPTAVRQDANAQIASGRRSAIVDAAARVSPAVVSVNVIRRVRQVVRPSVFDFFAVPRAYEREVQGIGSGFIISSDGLVITNQHVTEGAAEIIVTTRDGTDYSAELLGEDPLTDIAVLRIDADDPPTVAIGSSQDLAIGEWVVAFGNPFAYLLGNSEPTVTAGVVSAVNRNLLPSQDQTGIYVNMIQTDAPINPGNSGGPLANALGEIVGVNSSILTQSGGSVGIGFAIPIERALRVARELTAHGTVRRAWVGLEVAGADDLREWKELGGLRVTRVVPDSPADLAGLDAGDVLLTASTRPMHTFLDWESVKLDVSPGDTLSISVRRGNDQRRVNLTVEPLPTATAERVAFGDVEFITVTPAVQQERRLSRDFGALVFRVSDTATRQTGLREGDVILQVNRQRVESAEALRDVLREASGRGAVRVFYDRDGRILFSDFAVR